MGARRDGARQPEIDVDVVLEVVVRDILTSSPEHPRGIEVRLESGEVGRVRRILSRG